MIRTLQRLAAVLVMAAGYTAIWSITKPATTPPPQPAPPIIGHDPNGQPVDARQLHQLIRDRVAAADAAGRLDTCAAWARIYNRLALTEYGQWRPAELPAVIDETDPATDCQPTPIT